MVSTGSPRRKQLRCHQHLMLMVFIFLHVLSESLVMVALSSYSSDTKCVAHWWDASAPAWTRRVHIAGRPRKPGPCEGTGLWSLRTAEPMQWLLGTPRDTGMPSLGCPEKQLVPAGAIPLTACLRVKQRSHSVACWASFKVLIVTMKQFRCAIVI